MGLLANAAQIRGGKLAPTFTPSHGANARGYRVVRGMDDECLPMECAGKAQRRRRFLGRARASRL